MEKLLNVGIIALVLIFFLSGINNCSSDRRPQSRQITQYNTSVTVVQDASEGLDLQAVGEILKTVKTAEEFERKLNSNSPQINNLDLDENGQVDYISVTEYGSGDMRGFSLSTTLEGGETQEIANVEIEKDGEFVDSEIYGNQHIYGQNHYYHNRFGLTDFLLVSWLFQSRPFYHSPWGYNSYPSYYRGYPPMSHSAYRNTTAPYRGNNSSFSRQSSTRLKNTVASPNKNKNASTIKAPLKNPTQAQKSFQRRNPSKQVGSGGFGKRSSSRSRVPTVRSSSSRRSGSSFGGGK